MQAGEVHHNFGLPNADNTDKTGLKSGFLGLTAKYLFQLSMLSYTRENKDVVFH